MNFTKFSYKIACWAFIVIGVGHIATDLLSPKTHEQIEYIHAMKEFSINLLGTETNIYSLFQGFSIIMGLLFVSYGLINLFFLQNHKKNLVAKNIILLNILISLACMLLSLKYLFIVPITLTGLAFLAFTFSYINRKAKTIKT